MVTDPRPTPPLGTPQAQAQATAAAPEHAQVAQGLLGINWLEEARRLGPVFLRWLAGVVEGAQAPQSSK